MKEKIFKFILILFILTMIWGNIYILIPYFFQYSAHIAQNLFNKLSFFIFILFLIFFVFSVIKHIFLDYWKIFINNIRSKIKDFSKNKYLKIFYKNHPKAAIFLKNRFNKNDFFWLPFTSLSLVIIYTISVFLWFIEYVLTSDISVWLDDRLAAFFYAFRNDFLVNIFLWITYLWREIIVLWFFLIVVFYLYFKDKKNEIIALTISSWASLAFWGILKILLHHARPEYAIYNELSYSFPSNHAIISMSFYWYLTWILIRKTKSWKNKVNYLFWFLMLAFLIWFSRLYLWVHYLSDVLWWYLIWFLWLLFGIWLTEFLNRKYKKPFFHCFSWIDVKNRSILIIIWLWFFICCNYFFPYKLNEKIINYWKEKKITNFSEVFPANYLKYSQTFLWEKAENVNFIFLAKSDEDLENIFYKAKWYNSDKLNYESIKKMSSNLILEKPYNKAPITPIFRNNETQDFSFQKLPDEKDIRYRHHIRFWKTWLEYWEYNIYVWVWVYDDWLQWHLLHRIDPNIEEEVEYTFNDLKKTWLIENYEKIQLVKPYKWKNVFWDEFYSNWEAYLLRIKNKE